MIQRLRKHWETMTGVRYWRNCAKIYAEDLDWTRKELVAKEQVIMQLQKEQRRLKTELENEKDKRMKTDGMLAMLFDRGKP